MELWSCGNRWWCGEYPLHTRNSVEWERESKVISVLNMHIFFMHILHILLLVNGEHLELMNINVSVANSWRVTNAHIVF